MRKPIFSIAVAGLAVGLLAACTAKPTSEALKDSDTEVWSGDQITAELAGNTLYTFGFDGTTKWEWVGVFNADGTASGKTWWNGGGNQGAGTWEIVGDQLCDRWDNPDWGYGKRNCWEFHQDGDRVSEVGVSGPSKGEVFKVQIQPGNPYEL